MEIKPSGAVPSRKMPADWFTGTVWQDPIIEAPAPARIRAAKVSFEPGARTAWHTHPLGQTLHVVSGLGRVQTSGWSDPGNPARRYRVDSARRKALARGRPNERHGTHRHAGRARRRPRDVARARHRCAIWRSDRDIIPCRRGGAKSGTGARASGWDPKCLRKAPRTGFCLTRPDQKPISPWIMGCSRRHIQRAMKSLMDAAVPCYQNNSWTAT